MKRTITLFTVFLTLCTFAEVKLHVVPFESRGVPGELQKIELLIEMDSAAKAVLRVPHASNLVLRAVEKYPVSRSEKGGYLQRRVAVFQGVEAGVAVMTNLVVETAGEIHRFPPVTIEVLEVEKAEPPKAAEEKNINGKSLEEVLDEMPEKVRGQDAP